VPAVWVALDGLGVEDERHRTTLKLLLLAFGAAWKQGGGGQVHMKTNPVDEVGYVHAAARSTADRPGWGPHTKYGALSSIKRLASEWVPGDITAEPGPLHPVVSGGKEDEGRTAKYAMTVRAGETPHICERLYQNAFDIEERKLRARADDFAAIPFTPHVNDALPSARKTGGEPYYDIENRVRMTANTANPADPAAARPKPVSHMPGTDGNSRFDMLWRDACRHQQDVTARRDASEHSFQPALFQDERHYTAPRRGQRQAHERLYDDRHDFQKNAEMLRTQRDERLRQECPFKPKLRSRSKSKARLPPIASPFAPIRRTRSKSGKMRPGRSHAALKEPWQQMDYRPSHVPDITPRTNRASQNRLQQGNTSRNKIVDADDPVTKEMWREASRATVHDSRDDVGRSRGSLGSYPSSVSFAHALDREAPM